jgi:elongator complex protein 1
LHTHTKKNPPEYFEALKLVQKLKVEEKSKLKLEELINSTNNTKHKNADQALEYLCWIVNADILFDFALKTYDFELVIMVAKHTQKDPKEYLPYLRKLQEMDPVLMRYQINMDLKSYEDALIEVSKGGEAYFDKSLELITKYELYEKAFPLFKDNEALYANVYMNYAKYLEGKKNYIEAGYAFLRAKNNEAAMKNFTNAGAVNEITSLIGRMKITDLELLEDMFSEIIDICSGANKADEVERLFTWLKDKPYFVESLLCQSKLMDTLIRVKKWKLAYMFYYETAFPSVREEFNNQISLAANLRINEFNKNKQLFEEKYNRLLKVQHEKRTNPNLYILDNKLLEDNVSDTGSVVSSVSNKSSKSKKSTSSKMTKKSQKKISKRTVKEGSPLEEDFLIIILSELKLTVQDIDNVREFVSVLNYLKQTDLSKQITDLLNDYLNNVNPVVTYELISVGQQGIINNNPEMRELFPQLFPEKRGDKKTGIVKD